MLTKKYLTTTLILCTLVLSGCSVVSNDNPSLFSGTRDYEMKIIKSEVNINNVSFMAEKNLSVKNLLEKSGVEYEFNGNGKLSELDGVIVTASREWNVYINEAKSDLDDTVCNECKFNWKYEGINNQ